MEKKYSRLIIVLVISLIIVIAILLFFKFGLSVDTVKSLVPTSKKSEPTTTTSTAKTPKTISGKINEEPQATDTASAAREVSKDDLMRIASSFAERFGSYSNQSNFSNITDLKIFMTNKMIVWSEDFLRQQREKNLDTSVYYGITTKAVNQEVTEYDENTGIASILVSTRRREALNSTGNTTNVFDQKITINFVKEDGSWKVDSANWLTK